jgi:hypothetical protein
MPISPDLNATIPDLLRSALSFFLLRAYGMILGRLYAATVNLLAVRRGSRILWEPRAGRIVRDCSVAVRNA